MIINPLILPYSKFKVGDVMEPDEFNSNNTAITEKMNVIISLVSDIAVERDDDIFIPTYIKETHINPVEIRSPTISGNTILSSNGTVGFTSSGSGDGSVRFWAGKTFPNRNTAPFRVTDGGGVTMTKATVSGDFMTTNASGTVTTSRLWNEGTVGGRLKLNSNTGELNAVIGDASGADGNIGGTITLHNRSLSKKRISMGISADDDAGVINLINKSNKTTALMYGGSNLGDFGVMMLADSSGDFVTQLRGTGTSYFKEKLAIGGTTVVSNCVAQVNGNLNITGDIYIKGVKMKLTPA